MIESKSVRIPLKNTFKFKKTFSKKFLNNDNYMIDIKTLKEQYLDYNLYWKARFLFISSHPFNCSKFSRLKNQDFLKITLKDDNNLLIYFNQFKDVIKSDFLNYVDIIFLTPSMNLIIG